MADYIKPVIFRLGARISNFLISSVILNHCIWLKNVTSYLASEINILDISSDSR